MNFETNVRVKTPYGVKIFQNFHFQKHAPNILKTLAKKNFKNLKLANHDCLLAPICTTVGSDSQGAEERYAVVQDLQLYVWFVRVHIRSVSCVCYDHGSPICGGPRVYFQGIATTILFECHFQSSTDYLLEFWLQKNIDQSDEEQTITGKLKQHCNK